MAPEAKSWTPLNVKKRITTAMRSGNASDKIKADIDFLYANSQDQAYAATALSWWHSMNGATTTTTQAAQSNQSQSNQQQSNQSQSNQSQSNRPQSNQAPPQVVIPGGQTPTTQQKKAALKAVGPIKNESSESDDESVGSDIVPKTPPRPVPPHSGTIMRRGPNSFLAQQMGMRVERSPTPEVNEMHQNMIMDGIMIGVVKHDQSDYKRAVLAAWKLGKEGLVMFPIEFDAKCHTLSASNLWSHWPCYDTYSLKSMSALETKVANTRHDSIAAIQEEAFSKVFARGKTQAYGLLSVEDIRMPIVHPVKEIWEATPLLNQPQLSTEQIIHSAMQIYGELGANWYVEHGTKFWKMVQQWRETNNQKIGEQVRRWADDLINKWNEHNKNILRARASPLHPGQPPIQADVYAKYRQSMPWSTTKDPNGIRVLQYLDLANTDTRRIQSIQSARSASQSPVVQHQSAKPSSVGTGSPMHTTPDLKKADLAQQSAGQQRK